MILDMIQLYRSVKIGERTYTLRRLSFGALARTVEMLSVRALQFVGDEVSLKDANKLLESMGPHEMAEIVAMIVDPPDVLALEHSLDLLTMTKLWGTIQEMNDTPRIFESLGILSAIQNPPKVLKDATNRKNISSWDMVLDRIGARYGQPPHAVADWPADEVLTVLDIMDREVLAEPETQRVGVDAATIHPSDVAGMGGEYLH